MEPEAALKAAAAARSAKLRDGYKAPAPHKLTGSARLQASAAARLTAQRQSASLKRRRVAADDGVRWEMSAEATWALMMEIAATLPPSLPALRSLRRYLSVMGDDGCLAVVKVEGLLEVLAVVIAAPPTGLPAGFISTAPATPLITDEHRVEALWSCLNIAAGPHECTMHVVNRAGAALIAALSNDSTHVQEYAAWAVGNCAGDSQEARDALKAQGLVVPLVRLLQARSRRLACIGAWALTNMLKGQLEPAESYLEAGVLPLSVTWLQWHLAGSAGGAGDAAAWAHGVDVEAGGSSGEVVTEVAWICSYLAAKSEAVAAQVATAGALAAACLILTAASPVNAITPCLRILGNCAYLHPDWTALVFSTPGLLESLARVAKPNRRADSATASALMVGPRGRNRHRVAGSRGVLDSVSSVEVVPPGADGDEETGDSATVAGSGGATVAFDDDHTASLHVLMGREGASGGAGASGSGGGSDDDGATGLDALSVRAAPSALVASDALADAAATAAFLAGTGASAPASTLVAAAGALGVPAAASLHYSLGHVKECLWALTNIAAQSPAAATALLTMSLPPDVLEVIRIPDATEAHVATGFAPLAVHHISGSWQIASAAAGFIFALAAHTAVLPEAPAVIVRPFLPITLSFSPVLRAFCDMAAGGSLDGKHRALAFIDMTLHFWNPASEMMAPSPFAPPLDLASQPVVDIPPALRALAPPLRSGTALVVEAGGATRLEQLLSMPGPEADDEMEVPGLASHSLLLRWASYLLDTFLNPFIEAQDAGDDDDDGGEEGAGPVGWRPPTSTATDAPLQFGFAATLGAAVGSTGAPVVAADGHFTFGGSQAAAAPAPTAMRNVLLRPAWMSAAGAGASVSTSDAAVMGR